MDATRAFAAQDALVTMLAAALPAEYHVAFGWPMEFSEREAFVGEDFDAALDTPESWAEGIPLGQDETITLSVYLYVRKTGSTATEIREVLRPGLDLAVAALRADPTLAATVSFASLTASEYKWSFADAEGREREAQIKLTISAIALD